MTVAGADTLLGPEMRSTGEVMGIDTDFSKAYAKAALSAGQKLPTSGNVFVSMTDKFKEAIVPIAKELKVSTAAGLQRSTEHVTLLCSFQHKCEVFRAEAYASHCNENQQSH